MTATLTDSPTAQNHNRTYMWWCTVAATVAALETWAVQHPDSNATLSHLTRTACRTDTRAGRYIFAAAWSWFTIWFAHHILSTP